MQSPALPKLLVRQRLLDALVQRHRVGRRREAGLLQLFGYFNRFGYIFIVCATGKTAEEMFAILEARLPNDPETELRVAAAEQAKITQLRLEKL